MNHYLPEITIRLKKYSLFSAAYLLMQNYINGEVLYFDIDPDVVLDEKDEFYNLDVDLDGTNDFKFNNYSFYFSYTAGYYGEFISNWLVQDILIRSSHPNLYIAGSSNLAPWEITEYYPYALNAGEAVSEGLNWQNPDFHVMAVRIFYDSGGILGLTNGNWYPEAIDHYLGFKFLDNADSIHYGWLRCDVKDEGRTLIIKDYAYEEQNNFKIIAGSHSSATPIKDKNFDEINIYSYDSDIIVEFGNGISGSEIQVLNLAGEIILVKSVDTQFNRISLQEKESGYYFVKVNIKEDQYTKKVFIK